MIGLSPPSSAHPKVFQHQLVRPSAPRYRGFGLAMDRSPGFGSAAAHLTRYSHSLSLRLRHLRLNLARSRRLAGSLCKRHAVTPEGAPAVRGRMISGSLSLPSKGFFSPFPHGTRSLSVDGSIQPCGMGPTDSDGVSRVPPYSGSGAMARGCAHGAVTLCGPTFQTVAPAPRHRQCRPSTPAGTPAGLGYSAFARRYLRNLC